MKIASLGFISLLAIFCPLKHANSEVRSGSLTVFAVVGAECQLSAARNFNSYEAAMKNAALTLSVRCSGLAPYVVQLGPGAMDALAGLRDRPGTSRRAVFNASPKKQMEPGNEELEVPIAGREKRLYPNFKFRVSPVSGPLVANSDVVILTVDY